MPGIFDRGFFFFGISLYVSFILNIMPMGDLLAYVRPSWTLLLLLFLSQVLPGRFGLFTSFCVGLLQDILLDTVLGLHALSLVSVIYLQLLVHRQIKIFSSIQQMAFVFLISFIYLSCLRIVSMFFLDSAAMGLAYWLPALVNALIWPWFYILMSSFKNFIGIYESNN